MTIRAIYENGVFRPIEPVSLPDHAEVDVVLPPDGCSTREAVLSILRTNYASGRADVAERHDEHQP